jgi:outer membrane protein OmpA-like peptidoglycan-associated protein
MHSRALDILEKAGEKIKAAENVSAEYFSQEVLSEARQNYKEAEESLSRGEYEKSVELAEKAVALAEKAHQVSKEKLDLKNKIIERVSSIYGARVEPTEKGIRITFDRLFAPSGTKILFDAYPSLDAIGNALTEYPNPHVTIEAYTNDLKSEDENIKLSQSQAETVKSYLVSKGLSPERLKAEGHGSGKSSGKKVGNGYTELIIDLVKLDNT